MKRLLFLIWTFSLVGVLWSQDEKLADQYMQQGDFKQAAAIYEKVFVKSNYSEEVFRKLAEAYRNDANQNALEDLYLKQAKRFPTDVWYRIAYGELLERKGDNKGAKKSYEEALKNVSTIPDRLKRAASSFQMAGRHDYAMQVYEKGESFSGKYFYALERAELYYSNK
ncbi:MAG TPA: hypothetical protein VIL57_05360, partial [Bacteroidia bacterium]